MKSLLISLAFAAAPASAAPLVEQSQQATFQLAPIAEDLASPFGVAFLPDGSAIITEWGGAARLLRDGKASAPLAGAPPVIARSGRSGGLLGVTIDPGFAENRLVYFCYHHGSYDENVSRIGRARLVGERLENFEVIFEGDDRTNGVVHAGCRLMWDEAGKLIATFGDRRHLPDDAQDISSTTGSIIRINADGTIPGDNPFIDTTGARAEIWAYGVRNVQGLAKHPDSGEFWFSEHGPLGGDEINILRRGANYGWPIATYGIDYDNTIITEDTERDGVDGPLTYWRPSIAPSGLAFYTGDDFPQWRGDLFVGALATQRLIRMELRGDRILFKEELLAGLDQRIREVLMAPDGYLYILTDADPGGIYRLEPAEREPVQ